MAYVALQEKERKMVRVLIADDSPEIRSRLIALLAESAIVEIVGEAGTGKDTVSMTRKLAPDVVILDIVMPEGSGFWVLDTVRELAASPAMIVLTNYAIPQVRSTVLEKGARACLDKSDEFEELPGLLARLDSGLAEDDGRAL